MPSRVGADQSVEDGNVRVQRFHNPARFDLNGTPEDEIVEELAARLTAAVDRQRVADVPVGVLLSGGVDSTALATIMRHVLGTPPKTFTVGFEGNFDRDERTTLDDSARGRLVRESDMSSSQADDVIKYWQSDVADQDGLAQTLYVDARFSLPDNLLTYTDKMSMAASLEARVPFLDLELMAYAESIPSRLKIRGGSGKWILKKAMGRWLPEGYASRPKIAFETPLSNWLRGGQLAEIEERLTSPGVTLRRVPSVGGSEIAVRIALLG